MVQLARRVTDEVERILAPAWAQMRTANGKPRADSAIDWRVVRQCDIDLIRHYEPRMDAQTRWRAAQTIAHLRQHWLGDEA